MNCENYFKEDFQICCQMFKNISFSPLVSF